MSKRPERDLEEEVGNRSRWPRWVLRTWHRLSLWLHEEGVVAIGCAVISAVLLVLCFPPFNLAEAGYLFALPMLIYLQQRRSRKSDLLVAWFSGWFAWFILLIWLRHVTWVGLFFLSGILGLFYAAFLVFGAWILRKSRPMGGLARIFYLAGAAGIGVLLEALRSVLFTGFPWLPMAASQWNRPLVLQILEWTGTWGLTFILLFFNLALSSYLIQSYRDRKQRRWTFKPELLVGLILIVAFPLWLSDTSGERERVPLMRAGFVQPNMVARERWDQDLLIHNRNLLDIETMRFRNQDVDLLLWPEGVLPFFLQEARLREYLENLVTRVNLPVLSGVMVDTPEGGHNAAVLILPRRGVQDVVYAKRKLVPFGEYQPLIGRIAAIQPFLPISLVPGDGPELIPVPIRGETRMAGSLICYEDVFPWLARDSVRAGADFLWVATNNSWYGEEAGAYQHAIHSALRAVETRRPVLRVGNAGWSGWFDEYGIPRDSPLTQGGTIYFQGGGTLEVDRELRWIGRQTFYVRHGEWFLWVAFLLALFPLCFEGYYWQKERGKRREKQKENA